jgi:hypothetical protein
LDNRPISEQRQRRSLEIHRSSLAPAIPIPSDWYDADYFEHGLKSNWHRGYAWSSFQGLFVEAAAFLHEMFPSARSYVDAGCAKGFLVKALRERGLEAQGFDHSSWAIEHSEPNARQFLRLASIEFIEYADKCTDLLVAMSLLESLSEKQISVFLTKGRRWARTALFLTLPRQGNHDRDLSHITIREPSWWRQRFNEAGWREHELQEAARQHPLPQKMNWQAFVLEPES